MSEAQRATCIAFALPHLDKLGSASEASHLLKACLRDRALDPESAHLVVTYALSWIRANPQHEAADYIFTRLLPRRDLSDVDWKDISVLALSWLQSHSSMDNRDLSLAALLRRPELLETSDLDWVVRESEQWLSNPPGGAHVPDKLLGALKYLRRMQDPVRPEDDPGWIRQTVVQELDLAARGQTEGPSLGDIGEVLNTMAAALDTSRPASAAYLLPSLLAIVQPAKHAELWARLIELAQRILAHPKLLPRHRVGLSRAVWQLVDCGAWPEEIAGPVLEELDLARPGTERR